jgi:hypothetical protein
VEGVLASVNQWPQGILKKLYMKTEEKQIALQIINKSLYTQKRGLLRGTRYMRKDLHDDPHDPDQDTNNKYPSRDYTVWIRDQACKTRCPG